MTIDLPIFLPSGGYHSFILRLWQEQPGRPWRALLQNIQTGEVMHFARLEALALFLCEPADGRPAPPTALVDDRSLSTKTYA